MVLDGIKFDLNGKEILLNVDFNLSIFYRGAKYYIWFWPWIAKITFFLHKKKLLKCAFAFAVNNVIFAKIKQQGGYTLQVGLAQIIHGEQLKVSYNSFFTQRSKQC